MEAEQRKMKKVMPVIVFLGVLSLGWVGYSQAPQKPAITPVTSATGEQALFKQYCLVCHGGKNPEAGLHLDKLDTTNVEKDAEKWEMVVRKLRAGMMPPSGMPRPDHP